VFADSIARWHRREDCGDELSVRLFHHGVSGGNDEDLRALDVGVEREPAGLRDISAIDVAPCVPRA
jgi:hypothetical protein